MHGFIALSWILQAVKCHAISSPRYVTVKPVNRYNNGVMFSNIADIHSYYIYKVVYHDITHSFNNIEQYLIFVKFMSIIDKFIYQTTRIILSVLEVN